MAGCNVLCFMWILGNTLLSASGQTSSPVSGIPEVPLSTWETEIEQWETFLGEKPIININSAWLNVKSKITPIVGLYSQNDQCYECDVQSNVIVPDNGTTVLLGTAFGSYLDIRTTDGAIICSEHVSRLKERGDYWLIVFVDADTTQTTCNLVLANDPLNYNLPILWAFLVAIGLAVIWIIAKQVYKRAMKKRHESCEITDSTTTMELSTISITVVDKQAIANGSHTPAVPVLDKPAVPTSVSTPPPVIARKNKRLRSLDTFRGLSLVVMMFVNYGGGGYYFFEHAHWDGLFVADLVMPWFVWIMGVSITFSLRGQMRRGTPKWRIFLKILERTIKLFMIGLCLGARGGQDMKTIRIPGVLQRLAFSYFITASVHLGFISKGSDAPKFAQCKGCNVLRDIVWYWPEWIIMFAILATQLCLTYLLPVPGCATGYVGPGGLHMGGDHYNCTGGAAQYIDRVILTEAHIYQWPTIQGMYKTTMPYDPEGILGTLTTIFMCYLGLQAGKIISMYKGHRSRIIRWTIWAIITGVIGAVLCEASQFEGLVPLNKNLWSVSFILVMTSTAYVLLIFLYLVIDVANIWTGAPFIYPGMNSIIIYICHSVFGDYFPVSWAWPDYTQHWQRLFRALWSSVFFIIVSYVMYIKKIFIAL